MAAELSQEEFLRLGRCPFFRGADASLLQRVIALPGVTVEEAQTGEKNSILPVVAVVASVLLGGGAFYFIKRRR